ncbi:glycoside hydrolase family 62 protein [Hyaloscypha variabilis F]|uniref:Alpha-L-arabinofuranosidase n=1 Tax=Hyaloscypha variabilis (strain UAMH 11265 / GT02V1 / F) TaxID=1149755 RepID=A0A2J6QT70_HYAVF|nr:glycoside hydrolase family 62 protein [Hyaloscypha variabilis F]
MLSYFLLLAAAACAVAAPTPDSIARSSLPSTFEWSSSGPLVSVKSGSGYVAVKDPSIVEADGTYHVFATIADDSGDYNLVYFNFVEFSEANSATFHYLSSVLGSGYKAAPQIFYFEPHGLWYLIFQNGNAAYSTNSDISNYAGWSAPTNLFSSVPAIITENEGSGSWVDIWNICDSENCYLFSSDDNGHLYRAETTLSDFPNGFGNTVIAMEDTSDIYSLFEASCVYYTGSQYLLLVEAIGSDGYRYFRSWTSSSIDGTWTALADTETDPFASHYDVTFSGTAWTESISHGEMIRAGYDQTLTISPCSLVFLYQGLNPSSDVSYNLEPWELGLITQTNSAC